MMKTPLKQTFKRFWTNLITNKTLSFKEPNRFELMLPNTTPVDRTKAELLAYSSSWVGTNVATFLLTIPRVMLPELTRHRNFSFSVESSRAKSIEKVIEDIVKNKYYPDWTINKKGMSGDKLSDINQRKRANEKVDFLANTIINVVELSLKDELGIHKQNANRYLEPFQYIDVIVTGSLTDWLAFLELRHPQGDLINKCEDSEPHGINYSFPAQSEIQNIAIKVWNILKDAEPNYLEPGEYHLPYRLENDERVYTIEEQLSYASSKCATISFGNHSEDNKTKANLDNTNRLYKRLINHKHWSPLEHCLRVPTKEEVMSKAFDSITVIDENGIAKRKLGKYVSNISNHYWIQHRKEVENRDVLLEVVFSPLVSNDTTYNLIKEVMEFNDKRKLLDVPFSLVRELSFIIEEMFEIVGKNKEFETKEDFRTYCYTTAQNLINEQRARNITVTDQQILDGFIDIVIFGIGTAYKLANSINLNVTNCFKQVTDANSNKPTITDSHGKVIKDSDFVEPKF